MKIQDAWKIVVIATSVLLFSFIINLPTAAAATPCPSISYGETIACTIEGPGDQDAFTFVAQQGDTVRVRMTRKTGDTMFPKIQILRPDGTMACEASAYYSPAAEIISCPLQVVGTNTYTILAYDQSGTQAGNYNLSLQRLNNPGNARPIAFGETLTDAITKPAEMKTYTFKAEANDRVLIRATKISGETYFSPKFEMYNPDGSLVSCSVDTLNIISCSLWADGTIKPYTILAYDQNGNQTGNYSLYFQRLNKPGSPNYLPQSIEFGQTLPGTITLPAEMKTYTFIAKQGDTVRVRMTRTTGDTMFPKIQILRPDGTMACEASAYYSPAAEIISCPLQVVGTNTYTILAYDQSGTQAGSYRLSLQRLNNPGNDRPIAFGETLTDAITQPAEMKTYTFKAEANDRVLIRATKISGETYFSPKFEMYNPDGSSLVSCMVDTLSIISCSLWVDGTIKPYTILAYDQNGNQTGNYSLYIQRLNKPGSPNYLPQPIEFGQTLPGTITLPAEMKTYTFTRAGWNINALITVTNGTLDPNILLFNPTGFKVDCPAVPYIGINNCFLPMLGRHTILVFDRPGLNPGNYMFTLDASEKFSLVVEKVGTGGRVTSNLPGIDCGFTCDAQFGRGADVTISATTDLGWTFKGWEGEGCNGTDPCLVAMTQDRTVKAPFALSSQQLQVKLAGDGRGRVTDPVGIDCGTRCTVTFDYGTSITLTATPDASSMFVGWEGDCTGTGPCTVAMTQGRTITARFDSKRKTLVVNKSGTGSGTVTSTPPGITCGANCKKDFPSNTDVTLKANARGSAGVCSTFEGWKAKGDCKGTGKCSVNMGHSQEVTAIFRQGAPHAAVLIEPHDDIGVGIPTFRWKAVPGATRYYLEVKKRTVTGSQSKGLWYEAADVGCPTGIETCSIKPDLTTGHLAPGDAEWRVRSGNNICEGAWSVPMNVTVVTTP